MKNWENGPREARAFFFFNNAADASVFPFRPLHPSSLLRLLSLSLSLSLSLPLPLPDDWAAAALGQVLRFSLVSSPAASTHQVLPPLFFPSLLCEAEHRNPNLKLFSYLIDNPPNFEVFAKIIGCTCVHPCPFTGSSPIQCTSIHSVLCKHCLIRYKIFVSDIAISFWKYHRQLSLWGSWLSYD